MNELFYFNDDWKNIGVKLSGGADSAIIYYAVCNYYKDRSDVNIYPLTLDTKFKPWYSEGAKRVIKKVTELTGKAPEKHIIKYSNKHKDRKTANFYILEQSILQSQAANLYNLDVTYNGLTSNPIEHDILSSVREYYKDDDKIYNIAEKHILGRDTNRDLGQNIYAQTKTVASGALNIRPFVEGDKKLTYEAYKYYDRLHDLYPISYSCETRYQEHKLEEKNNHDWEHCGYCFFCAERIYAFGKLE